MKEPLAFTDRTYGAIVALVVAILIVVLAFLETGTGATLSTVLP